MLFPLLLCLHQCREFNQNPNLWEIKQIEKTHAKENNRTHKTIFTWFGNLPTSTELQGFHYYQGKYNNAQEHSKKTQIPIHPNSLSLTRQENPTLSSYAAARLLGIISIINSLLLAAYHKAHIYTCYFIKLAPAIPNTTCIRSISMTGLGLVGPYGLVAKFKPHFTPH